MGYLSPQAQKARDDAIARDRLWRPTLLRTSDKLILRHAVNNRRGQRQETANTMLALPGWAWDGKKRRFWADLTPENLETVLDAWKQGPYLYVNLSKGVHEYREQALAAAKVQARV
jgi:hypothetical protein